MIVARAEDIGSPSAGRLARPPGKLADQVQVDPAKGDRPSAVVQRQVVQGPVRCNQNGARLGLVVQLGY